MLRSEKGFTLLEVLVVVAIIIIIAGIALPKMMGAGEQAKIARVKGDFRVLQTAVESYMLFQGKIPANGTPSDLTKANPQIVSDYSQFIDPFSTAQQTYRYNAVDSGTGRQYYVFTSAGPNGVMGSTSVRGDGTSTDDDADDLFVTNTRRV